MLSSSSPNPTTEPTPDPFTRRKQALAERARAEAATRESVLRRLRWAAPAGLGEAAVAQRSGLPVIGVGAILRQLADRGDAHERDGVWYVGLDPRPGHPEAVVSTPVDVRARVLAVADGTWRYRAELGARVLGVTLATALHAIGVLVNAGQLQTEPNGVRVRLPLAERAVLGGPNPSNSSPSAPPTTAPNGAREEHDDGADPMGAGAAADEGSGPDGGAASGEDGAGADLGRSGEGAEPEAAAGDESRASGVAAGGTPVGRRIRAAREARGLTLAELARLVARHVPRNQSSLSASIGAVERGRCRPSGPIRQALERVLDLQLEDAVGDRAVAPPTGGGDPAGHIGPHIAEAGHGQVVETWSDADALPRLTQGDAGPPEVRWTPAANPTSVLDTPVVDPHQSTADPHQLPEPAPVTRTPSPDGLRLTLALREQIRLGAELAATSAALLRAETRIGELGQEVADTLTERVHLRELLAQRDRELAEERADRIEAEERAQDLEDDVAERDAQLVRVGETLDFISIPARRVLDHRLGILEGVSTPPPLIAVRRSEPV